MSDLLAAAGVSPAFEPAAIDGHPWTVDWRDQAPVTPDFQGYGGELGYLNLEGPTLWNPHLGLVVAQPYIPGYGGGGAPLDAEGELRAGSTIAWPTHGQTDYSNDIGELVWLENEGDVYLGAQLSISPDPRMVFAPPPSYSEQTTPIPAVGI